VGSASVITVQHQEDETKLAKLFYYPDFLASRTVITGRSDFPLGVIDWRIFSQLPVQATVCNRDNNCDVVIQEASGSQPMAKSTYISVPEATRATKNSFPPYLLSKKRRSARRKLPLRRLTRLENAGINLPSRRLPRLVSNQCSRTLRIHAASRDEDRAISILKASNRNIGQW
jgi:hypothetical protein